jgi:hypothetical protein
MQVTARTVPFESKFRLLMTEPYFKRGCYMERNEFDISPRYLEFNTPGEAEKWMKDNGHVVEKTS